MVEEAGGTKDKEETEDKEHMEARKLAGRHFHNSGVVRIRVRTFLLGSLCAIKVSVNIMKKESAKGRSVSREETFMK